MTSVVAASLRGSSHWRTKCNMGPDQSTLTRVQGNWGVARSPQLLQTSLLLTVFRVASHNIHNTIFAGRQLFLSSTNSLSRAVTPSLAQPTNPSLCRAVCRNSSHVIASCHCSLQCEQNWKPHCSQSRHVELTILASLVSSRPRA